MIDLHSRRRGDLAALAVMLVASALLAWILLTLLHMGAELTSQEQARDALARQVQQMGGEPVAGPPGSRGDPGTAGPAGPPGDPGSPAPQALQARLALLVCLARRGRLVLRDRSALLVRRVRPGRLVRRGVTVRPDLPARQAPLALRVP